MVPDGSSGRERRYGNGGTQYNKGVEYWNGDEVEQSKSEAAGWFRLAAGQAIIGSRIEIFAHHALGNIYKTATGNKIRASPPGGRGRSCSYKLVEKCEGLYILPLIKQISSTSSSAVFR